MAGLIWVVEEEEEELWGVVVVKLDLKENEAFLLKKVAEEPLEVVLVAMEVPALAVALAVVEKFVEVLVTV